MRRLLIIGPIAALAVTGCGSTSKTTPAAPTAGAKLDAVPVTLTDFKIRPASRQLQAGKTKFEVTNQGKMAHEFVVIDTKRPAAGLRKGKRASEKGSLGETGNVKPGQSKTLVVNLRKGHYAVICNDPGHYMAGMHTDLYVR